MKNSTWCQMSRRGSCWGWKSQSRWTCLHQLLSSEATIYPPLFSEFGKHPAKMKMSWECECSKLVKFLKPFSNIKKAFCLLQILLNLQVWSTKPALEWTPHCKISPLPAHCIYVSSVKILHQAKTKTKLTSSFSRFSTLTFKRADTWKFDDNGMGLWDWEADLHKMIWIPEQCPSPSFSASPQPMCPHLTSPAKFHLPPSQREGRQNKSAQHREREGQQHRLTAVCASCWRLLRSSSFIIQLPRCERWTLFIY